MKFSVSYPILMIFETMIFAVAICLFGSVGLIAGSATAGGFEGTLKMFLGDKSKFMLTARLVPLIYLVTCSDSSVGYCLLAIVAGVAAYIFSPKFHLYTTPK